MAGLTIEGCMMVAGRKLTPVFVSQTRPNEEQRVGTASQGE